MLCLDSKIDSGRLGTGKASSRPWLCLDSKIDSGRLKIETSVFWCALCLDSKIDSGRLDLCKLFLKGRLQGWSSFRWPVAMSNSPELELFGQALCLFLSSGGPVY